MPTPMPQPMADNHELAKQLYDLLMSSIEPDLMLASIPLLDEKYKDETAADHEIRMQRYENSYKKFDQEFALFMGTVHEKVRSSRRQSLKEEEQQASTADQTIVSTLESAFH